MSCATLGPLEGFTIGITAERRWREQANLLMRRGARVIHGPSVTTRFLGDDRELRRATVEIANLSPDFFVANTGVGMRSWIEAARSWDVYEEIVEALGRTTIIARGAKAASVVHSIGLAVAASAANETLDEVFELLAARHLAGRRVALQLDGIGGKDLTWRLESAGAEVVTLPIYQLSLPEDVGPALRLVSAACERRVDAVTFTSAPAVHNFFMIAANHGLEDDLRTAFAGGVTASCVGPVCARAAIDEHVAAPVAPEIGRLGLLVRSLTAHLSEKRQTFRMAGEFVTLQGAVVVIGERVVSLSGKERAVFGALAESPGATVSFARLERRVWGSVSGRSHGLQVTIARLRKRLGPHGAAIITVPRRGYRIDMDCAVSVG